MQPAVDEPGFKIKAISELGIVAEPVFYKGNGSNNCRFSK